MKKLVSFDKVYDCLDSECKFIIDQEVSTIETDKKDMPLTRKTITLKELDVEDNDNIVTGYISTRDLDHSLDVMIPEGVILDIYQKNPLILWNHNSSEQSIAKCMSLIVDGYGLKATIEFADTEFANDFRKLVKGGFLSCFSVGFIPIVAIKRNSKGFKEENEALMEKYPEYNGLAERIIKQWILLEASIVTLPDNPRAVITQKNIDEMELKSHTIEMLKLKCIDCQEANNEFKEKIEEAKAIDEDCIRHTNKEDIPEVEMVTIEANMEKPLELHSFEKQVDRTITVIKSHEQKKLEEALEAEKVAKFEAIRAELKELEDRFTRRGKLLRY